GLSDQGAQRRETHFQCFHADFGAAAGIGIDDGAELDDRPGKSLERQRHVAQLDLAALGHGADNEVAHLAVDERQRDRRYQEYQVERCKNRRGDPKNPGRNLGCQAQCWAPPDLLTWLWCWFHWFPT